MEQALTIPSQYRGGFAKIRRLSDTSARELVDTIRALPLSLRTDALLGKLSSRIDTIPPGDLAEIVPALLALYSLRTQLGSTTPLGAEYVTQAMEESGTEELMLDEEERDSFRNRLIELLSLNSIEIGSRASNLLFEYERVLQEARILTDIRPVFGSDPETSPEAAVVVHTLKLGYYDSNAYRELYFALDDGDVPLLQALLERADKKSKSLRSVLAAANVPYVSPE